MPAAAPTFSTITWPKPWPRCGANTRATTSNAPPAANGTTMVTGRVGQSCAGADEPGATSAGDAIPIIATGRVVKSCAAADEHSATTAAASILILGMGVLPV